MTHQIKGQYPKLNQNNSVTAKQDEKQAQLSRSNEAGALAQCAELLFGTPASFTGVPGLSPGYSELWVQLPADVPGKQQIMSKVRARLPLAYQKEVRVPTQMSHQNSLSGWRHLSRCTRQGLSVPRGYLENGVSGGFEPLDAFVPTST